MCELDQLAEMGRRTDGMSRRKFAVMGASAGLGATLVGCATAAEPGGAAQTESAVTITTPDGTMDAFFVHPGSGRHPAVIIWPDIAGLRESFRMMARRLASSNYAVLVVNPFYRDRPAPQFEDFADFQAKGGFQMVGPWREKLTAEAIMRDAKALAAWLDAQGAVDASRGIGNQGYCMGGPLTVWSIAGAPDRIKAAASFHGGGLVGDSETAPINLFDDLPDDAHLLIAIAKNDDARAPDDKTKLRERAEQEDVKAEIEVYEGDHGWTVYDSPVYNEPAAEKAWERLLATYQAAL